MNSLPKRVRLRAIASLLACLAPPAARADAEADRIRGVVDAVVVPLMARHDVPGMAVAVTVDGRSHVFNYGLASRESEAPIGEATIFEIGSVSKMFTATLAAYAQARGQLSLDDHPGRYVPGLKGRPVDAATLRHLGTYTAGGLPLQFPDEVGDDDPAAVAWLRAWKAAAAPGTRREYSNPSMGLLGFATAAAMKDGFAHAVETQLFPKFGMRHSFVRVPEGALADYAWGYREGKPVRVHPGPFDEETYGVRSTAADLIRFVQANIDPSGLEAPLQRAVATTHVGRYRVGTMVQGFGWEQYAWPVSRETLLGGNSEELIFDPNPVQAVAPQATDAPRLFDKTGSTGGFGAYLAFVPAKKIGVVLLANRNYPIPARVEAGFAILEQLAPAAR